MSVMENSRLLFSSCHLKLIILENNRLLLENSKLFVKIASKKLTIFQQQPVIFQNSLKSPNFIRTEDRHRIT